MSGQLVTPDCCSIMYVVEGFLEVNKDNFLFDPTCEWRGFDVSALKRTKYTMDNITLIPPNLRGMTVNITLIPPNLRGMTVLNITLNPPNLRGIIWPPI
jgi:hypothetical protein